MNFLRNGVIVTPISTKTHISSSDHPFAPPLGGLVQRPLLYSKQERGASREMGINEAD